MGLDAGLQVLCKKPMANSVADAREIHTAAEAAGVNGRVRVPGPRHPGRSDWRQRSGGLDVPYRLHSAGPRHFIDAILAGDAPAPSFLDGVKAQEPVDAALRASAEERWIGLS